MKIASAAEAWTRSRLGHNEAAVIPPTDHRRELVMAAVGGNADAVERCDLLYSNWRSSALARATKQGDSE